MKKLFISQPIKGKTDEEIFSVRKRAIESAKRNFGEPIEIIDTFINESEPNCVTKELWYLAKRLEMLAEADVAYFTKEWETDNGCKIENTCAIEYDIDVIEDYRAD